MNRLRGAARVGMLAAVVLLSTTPTWAGAIRTGFDASTLARNDDGSTGLVPIGFSVDFFGWTADHLYVNNNGNVTFTAALSTFTPFNLYSNGTRIIAPFFADVDTRGTHGNPTRYGTGTVNGRNAFGVTWIDVDYYTASATHTLSNSFQLLLIERFDTGAGNFDIELNYDKILWETGDVSGGENGLGGSSARAGYSNGTAAHSFELPGSGVPGSFLDGNGTSGLVHNSLGSTMSGRYLFTARNGIVEPTVPEPSSLALMGLGMAALLRRRRR